MTINVNASELKKYVSEENTPSEGPEMGKLSWPGKVSYILAETVADCEKHACPNIGKCGNRQNDGSLIGDCLVDVDAEDKIILREYE